MILNQNGDTPTYNKFHEIDFINDGWTDIDKIKPINNQRVLVVGDIKFATDDDITRTNPRRISFCKYLQHTDEFIVCDAEYYFANLTNVKWWKPIVF